MSTRIWNNTGISYNMKMSFAHDNWENELKFCRFLKLEKMHIKYDNPFFYFFFKKLTEIISILKNNRLLFPCFFFLFWRKKKTENVFCPFAVLQRELFSNCSTESNYILKITPMSLFLFIFLSVQCISLLISLLELCPFKLVFQISEVLELGQ